MLWESSLKMKIGKKQIRDGFTVTRLAITHPFRLSLLGRIRRDHLTYLELAALVELSNVVAEIENNKIPGVFIEAGCALGGSALAITATKKVIREFQVYDTFKMIPPPSQMDGEDAHARYNEIIRGNSRGLGGETYYGYMGDLTEFIQKTFVRYGFPLQSKHVTLVKGLFHETLQPTEAVAMAHLDCDWFESVMVCLERIVPVLSVGGMIVIDDYDHWSGARRAVDEFFSRQEKENFRFTQRSRLHIQRIAPGAPQNK